MAGQYDVLVIVYSKKDKSDIPKSEIANLINKYC